MKRIAKLYHQKWAEMIEYSDAEPELVLEGEPVVATKVEKDDEINREVPMGKGKPKAKPKGKC